jgi:hypothetical protein
MASEYIFRDEQLMRWKDGPAKSVRVLFDTFCTNVSIIYKAHGIDTSDLIRAHATAHYVAPEVFQHAWNNLFALLDRQKALFCPACDAAIRKEIEPLQKQFDEIASS